MIYGVVLLKAYVVYSWSLYAWHVACTYFTSYIDGWLY